jgi:hypothetical protein
MWRAGLSTTKNNCPVSALDLADVCRAYCPIIRRNQGREIPGSSHAPLPYRSVDANVRLK